MCLGQNFSKTYPDVLCLGLGDIFGHERIFYIFQPISDSLLFGSGIVEEWIKKKLNETVQTPFSQRTN